MTSQAVSPTPSLWAHFRFSIVGSLLSAPVAHGGLRQALQDLADKTWTHPVNGGPIQYSASTIERWYYAARAENIDPVGVLKRRVRSDSGQQPSITDRLRETRAWRGTLSTPARVSATGATASPESSSASRVSRCRAAVAKKRGSDMAGAQEKLVM